MTFSSRMVSVTGLSNVQKLKKCNYNNSDSTFLMKFTEAQLDDTVWVNQGLAQRGLITQIEPERCAYQADHMVPFVRISSGHERTREKPRFNFDRIWNCCVESPVMPTETQSFEFGCPRWFPQGGGWNQQLIGNYLSQLAAGISTVLASRGRKIGHIDLRGNSGPLG